MNLKDLITKYNKKIGDLGLEIKKYKNTKIEINNNILKLINIKDNKDIINCNYYPIGSYDIEREIWNWNFNNFSYDKSNKWIKIIKDFKEKLIDFNDFEFIEEANYYLSKDLFIIENHKIYDLVRLVNFILKGLGTYTIEKNINNIKKLDFFIIKDIILDNR